MLAADPVRVRAAQQALQMVVRIGAGAHLAFAHRHVFCRRGFGFRFFDAFFHAQQPITEVPCALARDLVPALLLGLMLEKKTANEVIGLRGKL